MNFRGKVKYIGYYHDDEGWCIDVMFRDAAAKLLYEALGHTEDDSSHLIIMMIPCAFTGRTARAVRISQVEESTLGEPQS